MLTIQHLICIKIINTYEFNYMNANVSPTDVRNMLPADASPTVLYLTPMGSFAEESSQT